ncbi:MAG: extracellular solute-binding protein [Lachnospiraceae bacterium]|nr:extracellular solute-binding protein [Lachnospiraceae bacterium]
MTKKILSIMLLCCIVLLVISAKVYVPGAKEHNLTDNSVTNITVWYTDDAMEAYLNEATIAYQEQTGIAVSLKKVSGLEYLEGIQEASVHTGDGPDAYIVNSDSLEKARLAGLAAPMKDAEGVLNTSNYPQIALNAVTYNDKILGYPFTYETAAFFYNDTYLKAMAQPESGEKAVLPTSMVGLLEFANTYEPVEGMETYLLWDVADVMYNYGFAGAYMNTGGVHGDDRNEIDIYNTDAMYCLSVYQDFNQFFSIDANEVDYESVKEDFISGKVMFTIGGTNLMNTLEKAKADGTFTSEYGVMSIEMLNDSLAFKPLSVTTVVAVNEYSEKREAAEDFAQFISLEYVDNLYARSGKLCAHYLEEYPVAAMADMMTCYENSVALPKIVENSNYWILAELCYTNIWNGGDVNAELMDLSSQVKKEITGEAVTELKLDTPVVTESYITEE